MNIYFRVSKQDSSSPQTPPDALAEPFPGVDTRRPSDPVPPISGGANSVSEAVANVRATIGKDNAIVLPPSQSVNASRSLTNLPSEIGNDGKENISTRQRTG